MTADPTEGEAYAEAGDNIVECCRCPKPCTILSPHSSPSIMSIRAFFKRKRTRADPEALAPHRTVRTRAKERVMSEKDDFLSRWSRRKQAAAREAKLPQRKKKGAAKAVDATDEPPHRSERYAPDAANRNRNSISANCRRSIRSDPTPTSGVSCSRAYRLVIACGASPRMDGRSGDPRLYRACGEPWDFTKPESIPGFGPLLPIDDVKRLLSEY